MVVIKVVIKYYKIKEKAAPMQTRDDFSNGANYQI